MILKATSKIRLPAWLRQKFILIDHYFSLNGVKWGLSDDDVTE